MYSPKRRFRLFRSVGPPAPPTGTANDVLSFARTLATSYRGYDITPTDGGPLTLNSQSLGRYEITARRANTTLSSFTASDWFTSVKDTRSAWVVVNGDLTINGAVTFTPPVRKLFMVLYVTGNLTFTGSISMTARGANHSGTGDSGGYVAPANIRIATGTYNGVLDYTPGSTTNPTIPATGAAGGVGLAQAGAPAAGSNGTLGQSGGGTAGVWDTAGPAPGSGSAGTSFSGGAGGGSQRGTTPASTSGGANGGAGGNTGGSSLGGGGAGNPGGAGIPGGYGGVSADGASGTGGTLIVICEGIVNGGNGGALYSRGSAGGAAGGLDGGGSGGGSMTLMYGQLSALTNAFNNGTGSTPGGSGSWRRYAIGLN